VTREVAVQDAKKRGCPKAASGGLEERGINLLETGGSAYDDFVHRIVRDHLALVPGHWDLIRGRSPFHPDLGKEKRSAHVIKNKLRATRRFGRPRSDRVEHYSFAVATDNEDRRRIDDARGSFDRVLAGSECCAANDERIRDVNFENRTLADLGVCDRDTADQKNGSKNDGFKTRHYEFLLRYQKYLDICRGS